MFGYSATGSCTIATTPTITMRMEITIATMGRLMKNFAMAGVYFGAAGSDGALAASPIFWPWRTRSPPSTTTRSPGLSPSAMTHSGPTRTSHFTVRTSTVSSSLTTATCCVPCTSWTARCGTSSAPFRVSTTARTLAYWPGRSTLPGFEKTPRASKVPVVTSTCRSRAAARPRGRHAGPRIQHRGVRGRHPRQVGEVALDRIVELLLADRPALGQRRVAADVELRLTLGGLRPLDLGLGLDDGGQGLFDLCLAGAHLGLGLAQLRLRQLEPGVGLIGGGLKRPRIDLEQQVAALDEGALLVVLAHEMPADAGTDLRVDVPDQRPHILEGDRHVPLDDWLDLDHRGRGRRGGAGRVATAGGDRRHQAHQQARRERIAVVRHELVPRIAG